MMERTVYFVLALLVASQLIVVLAVGVLVWRSYQERGEIRFENIAGRIAENILRDYNPDELDRTAVQQYARTRYMRMVADLGLPAGYADQIAQRVIAIINEAAGQPVSPGEEFAFYE